VLLSVIAHGVTANPLVKRMARRPSAEVEEGARAPAQDQTDVAEHGAWILEHLGPEVEAERPEVLVPEFVSGLGSDRAR
jgi:hypothetical protein